MRTKDYAKMGVGAHVSVSYMLGSGLCGTLITVACPVCGRAAIFGEGRRYKTYTHKEVIADVWENAPHDDVCLVDKNQTNVATNVADADRTADPP